jgi:hypothetical protein
MLEYALKQERAKYAKVSRLLHVPYWIRVWESKNYPLKNREM